MSVLVQVFTVLTLAILAYYILYYVSTLILILVAGGRIRQLQLWSYRPALEDIYVSPLTPAVTVLVPAHNEVASIRDSVHSLLAMRFPNVQIVVIDDGSTDGTFEALEHEFELRRTELPRVHSLAVDGAEFATYTSAEHPLDVVRKESIGRRADALNAGLQYARHELVCMIDADSMLEPDALLHIVQPFLDDATVIAAGGVVRPANGARVRRGFVESLVVPRGWIERIQIVEYLRAFLLARTAWSANNSLLIISGAFGLFRTDAVVAVGGLDHSSMAEDTDLVLSLHRRFARERIPYRIVFVPEPVCWTEVPSSLASLSRQRRRWSHGAMQVVGKHRDMVGNPRYGGTGMLALPFFVLFECLSPLVEAFGLLLTVIAAALGLVSWWIVVLMLVVSVGLGFFVSMVALVVEEVAYHRYHRWQDLAALALAALVETVGFRELHALWRLRGIVDAITGRHAEWGVQSRAGFGAVQAAPTAARAPSRG